MSEYYHIVPWFNSKEWHEVHQTIYSPTSTLSNKEEALHTLLVWKVRCPSLPSGLETTLTMLQVHIQDVKNMDNIVNDQLLRLAYSSAIMRFVNHMLDTETAKGTSLYQAAKNLDVPDWIIDIRHDAAHNNNLPSLELLREACSISLDWLKKHYWEKCSTFIQDYTAGQKEFDTGDEYKIAKLMNLCTSLSFCTHPNCKIKNLSEIPNPSMREAIVNDARDLFGEYVDFSNLKTVSVTSLFNTMSSQSKKLLKGIDPSLVNKAILGEDSLFLSAELVNFLGEGGIKKKRELNKGYVQCFEMLLTFLHTHEYILDFVLGLIKIAQDNDNEGFKRRLAALWVSEILKSLKRCKNFTDKMDNNNTGDRDWKNKKNLKSLFRHWFPSETGNCLLLDLQKPIPMEFTNMSVIQPIISEYNTHLTFFIKDLLNLVEPQLPKVTSSKICNLAKLISSPDRFAATASKIYTVNDVKIEQNNDTNEDDSDSDCVEINESYDNEKIQTTERQVKSGIWSLASKEHNWGTCPIGLLPWQQAQESEVPMELN